MSSALPVAITGFSWGTALLGMLNLLIGGVLVAVIRSRPALKKIANEREKSLLEERAADMETMRVRLEKLEAERSVDRHRLNNVTACLDALLLLLETAPDKAPQHVARIKAMREAQMKAEAAEKGAIHAQSIERAETKA
jgi:hypothetical protein